MLFLPEGLIFFGSLALLLLGVLSPRKSELPRQIRGLAQGILALALLVIALRMSKEGGLLFHGLLVVDRVSDFLKILILGSGFVVISFLGVPSKNQKEEDAYEWPIVVLWSLFGMCVMVSAHDFMAVYLGLEVQSLALYLLAAKDRTCERSAEAGLKYFVLGALSSGLFLYGISLVYGLTGTTSFSEIGHIVATSQMTTAFGVAMILALCGLVFKVSAVPFHMWTPDVYDGAPTAITAFFASAPKIAALGLLMRIVMEPFFSAEMVWRPFMLALSMCSVFLGAFGAIAQTRLKRLLAYSSIAHVGYILLALATTQRDALFSVLFYLGIYAITILAVFSCLLMMQKKDGHDIDSLDDFSGLSQTYPKMAALLMVLFLSLAGIPPVAGFFAKYFVLISAVKAGFILPALGAVVASVVSAFYYLRLIKKMYIDSVTETSESVAVRLPWIASLFGAAITFFLLFAEFYWRFVTWSARIFL